MEKILEVNQAAKIGHEKESKPQLNFRGIDKDVPIPKYTRKKSTYGSMSLPLKKMEIGDSKVVPIKYTKENINRLRTKIYTMVKKEGLTRRHYTVNVDPVSDEFLRVWRTV